MYVWFMQKWKNIYKMSVMLTACEYSIIHHGISKLLLLIHLIEFDGSATGTKTGICQQCRQCIDHVRAMKMCAGIPGSRSVWPSKSVDVEVEIWWTYFIKFSTFACDFSVIYGRIFYPEKNGESERGKKMNQSRFWLRIHGLIFYSGLHSWLMAGNNAVN
jgi:hypothetical protein